jgi:lysophospholipase L1-like esterase
MRKLSLGMNVFLGGFLLWYFCFHVGLDTYYRKYISPKESFDENPTYLAAVRQYAYLNKGLSKEISYDVFVGDSIIKQFPINEMIKSDKIINRGMAFDTTAGLLKRLETTIGNINMRRLFLMVGHNDLKYRSPDETIDNLKKIIERVNAPKTVCISVLPTSNRNINDKTIDLNKKIERLCDNTADAEYLDLYSLFTQKNGDLKENLFYDGTHLEPEGYMIIVEKLNSQYSLNRVM